MLTHNSVITQLMLAWRKIPCHVTVFAIINKGNVNILQISEDESYDILRKVVPQNDTEEDGFLEIIGNIGHEVIDIYDDWLDNIGLWFFPRPIKIFLTVLLLFVFLSFAIYILSGGYEDGKKKKA